MTATNDGIIHLKGRIRDGKLVALLDHEGKELGAPVTALEQVTGMVKILGRDSAELHIDSGSRFVSHAIPLADFSAVGHLGTMPAGFVKSAVTISDSMKATAGKFGNASIEITCPTGTGNANFDTTNDVYGSAAVANKTVYFVIEVVTGWQHLAQIIFFTASDNTFTNYGTTNLVFQRNGTYVFAMTLADVGMANDIAQSGTIDWGAIKKFRFNTQFVGGVAAGNVVFRLHSILTHAREAVPAWTMVFDDSNLSDYTIVKPLAEEYGLKLGFSVIPTLVGTGGYCTDAQIREIYDAGHDILIHGEQSTQAIGSVAANMTQFNSVRNWMVARGLTRGANFITYVQGANFVDSDPTRRELIDALNADGFIAGVRASDYGFANLNLLDHTTRLSLPRYKINDVNVANLLRSVDANLNRFERAGTNSIFMGHRVLNATSGAVGEDTYLHNLRQIFANVRRRIDAGTMRNLSPVEMVTI